MTGAVQKIGFGLNLFYLYKHKYINNITRYNILYKWDSDFFSNLYPNIAIKVVLT